MDQTLNWLSQSVFLHKLELYKYTISNYFILNFTYIFTISKMNKWLKVMQQEEGKEKAEQ